MLFFAPSQVKKRLGDWGPEAFGQRVASAWAAFTRRATLAADPWLVVERHSGTESMESVYRDVLGGSTDPRKGHIVVL